MTSRSPHSRLCRELTLVIVGCVSQTQPCIGIRLNGPTDALQGKPQVSILILSRFTTCHDDAPFLAAVGPPSLVPVPDGLHPELLQNAFVFLVDVVVHLRSHIVCNFHTLVAEGVAGVVGLHQSAGIDKTRVRYRLIVQELVLVVHKI